ncbi:MAG TPA: hypothetical protein VFY45_00885 [Baekduia sp.]|nr:hypothetical protein [Baekduia sp.]
MRAVRVEATALLAAGALAPASAGAATGLSVTVDRARISTQLGRSFAFR